MRTRQVEIMEANERGFSNLQELAKYRLKIKKELRKRKILFNSEESTNLLEDKL